MDVPTVTAFEFITRLPGGQSRPPLVDVEHGPDRRTVVLKALADHDGVELSAELVCAMLGRSLGLPLPDFFVVELTQEFAQAVPTQERRYFEKSVGLAFGTLFIEGAVDWRSKRLNDVDWVEFLRDLIVFDSVFANRDRGVANSNVLFDGSNRFLIDHCDALDQHLLKSADVREALARDHCGFESLHWKGADFLAVVQRWLELYGDPLLNTILPAVPESGTDQEFEAICDSLSDRGDDFEGIAAQLSALTAKP